MPLIDSWEDHLRRGQMIESEAARGCRGPVIHRSDYVAELPTCESATHASEPAGTGKPVAPVPPRYWWLKRILIVSGTFLIVLIGVRLWWGWEANRQLQAEIDRITAAGEPIYPVDFDPPPMRPEENAAKLYLDAEAAPNLNPTQGDFVNQLASEYAEIRKRLDEVELQIKNAGFSPMRKTELDEKDAVRPGDGAVILVDTMGELTKIYSVADIVFVGGSLISHGGQNMLEPAALGKAVLFGPHTHNFNAEVDMLLKANAAVQVDNAEKLAENIKLIIADKDHLITLSQNARQAVAACKGVTERTLGAIGHILTNCAAPGEKVTK